MQAKIKRLLEPIQVGPLLLKNRMIMSPVRTRFATVNGEVTDQLIDYYIARARNKPGMITTGSSYVDYRHVAEPLIRIDDNKFLPGLSRLVDVIHVNNVPVVIQLNHKGAFGTDPISPSGVASYTMARKAYVQPRAMTLGEAEEARDFFIAAAVRAENIGFDGVEIMGGASYLLQQFVSPHTNKRTDRYGGSFENRITMPVEIVRGIRGKCGSSFVIGYAMVADELLPGGTNLEESKAFAKVLEKEGVDYISVMVGTYETGGSEEGRGRCLWQRRGLFDISQQFKEIVDNMKVFARSAGAHDLAMWEEALEKGQADAITLGRPLLCDPELPKKVSEGRPDDIRLCVRCGYCTERGVIQSGQVDCALNSELGREREYAIKHTANPKHVLVIGGGPAGLEAARVAALRRHEVTLMEKEAQLGGNLRIASLAIGKEHYKSYFLDWLEHQCRKAGVKIELSKEVTRMSIEKAKPDVVIVATGATPVIPEIHGVNMPHVVMAADVLTGRVRVGKKVIVAGGGQVGVETSLSITEKGLAESVTIIEQYGIAADMYSVNRAYVLTVLLPKYGIKTFTNMHIEEIKGEGVVARARDQEWKKYIFEADTVVIAMGYTPNRAIYEGLSDQVQELYMIGDCVKARQIANAVHEGAYVARQI